MLYLDYVKMLMLEKHSLGNSIP